MRLANLIYALVLAALLPQVLWLSRAEAANLPLKPGTYLCVTATLMPGQVVLPTDLPEIARRGANAGLDIKQQRPLANQTIGVVPAGFGRIVLDGKGNYQMPTIRQSGRYGFNPATGRPTFTGDLGIMLQKEYNGKGTSFNLAGGGMNFNCALQGATSSSSSSSPSLTTQRADSLGPITAKANAQNFSGRFQGTYVCSMGENAITLEMLADAEGRLVAIMTFGGVRNLPRGRYKMAGGWRGSQFKLEGIEWIEQPPNYSMTNIEGEVRSQGVTGKLASPNCSNFVARRVGS